MNKFFKFGTGKPVLFDCKKFELPLALLLLILLAPPLLLLLLPLVTILGFANEELSVGKDFLDRIDLGGCWFAGINFCVTIGVTTLL